MKRKSLMIDVMFLTCMMLMGFTADVYSQEKSNIPEKPVVQQMPTKEQPYMNPRIKRRGIIVIADLNVIPLTYTGSCPAVFILKGQIYANKPMTVFYKIVRSDNTPMKAIALTFKKKERKEITHTWQIGDSTKPSTFNEWALIEVVYPINAKIRSNAAFLRGSCTNQADSKQQDALSQQEIKKVQATAPIDSSGPQLQGKEPMPTGLSITRQDQKGQPATGNFPLMPPPKSGQGPDIFPIPPQPGQKGALPMNTVIPQSSLNELPETAQEHCVSFDPATAVVQQIQGVWSIIDSPSKLLSFGIDKIEAENSLAIIKHYTLNQSCFVGSPRPSFHYMLTGNAAPAGTFSGEDCLSFNPATINVRQIKGNWKVVDSDRSLFDFGTNKTEADQALAIIKKYGFTHSCMMARGKVDFLYLRK
ncbi:MAG: hypothetical protein NT010_08355 [Proteobacteria bacterium]|nr:hypothetical protein [Pseudomonadota bacterium]